jgi:GTPase SAR1 family protein
MLERYTQTKKFLLQVKKELEKSSHIDPYIIENSMLEQEITRLENGNFKIALVAPFSAGKSTFINSIIGKDLLSMDIRAETSVITKIAYSEEIRIEVTYFENNKVDVFERDEQGNALTYDTCKEILQKITTVRDQTNEEKIQQVIVYCPLDICRDNVELIDTPGLFSRHEKHEAITNNIIPQVNAVIFMIDPDSVGEEHFTEKIRNYVNSAKTSSLEEDGRHIYFVINKIDVFNEEDIAKARHELEQVLSGLILKPNIHEVSAYFGMRGKQLLTKDLDIQTIQKDRKIGIPDPEDPDYTIAGKQISEEHAQDIIKFSKIRKLENALGEYLQSKNQYLISDVVGSIRSVLSDTIHKLEFEIHEINGSINEDKAAYIQKINNLKNEIEEIKEGTVQQVNSLVTKTIVGSITGSSLDDQLTEEIEDKLIDISKDIEREVFKKWSRAKVRIDRYNAEEIVQTTILDAEEFLVQKVKELVKDLFLDIQKIIGGLISEIQEQLNLVTEKLEAAEVKNLGTRMEKIGTFNVENLVGSTMKKIETEFSTIIVSIAKDCQEKVQGAYDNSIYEVKKGGFVNWFKGLFGSAEYEERFDLFQYKKELDRLINDLTDTMKVRVMDSETAVATPIIEMSRGIVKDINSEVSTIINNVVKIKSNVLNSLIAEMNSNKEEKLASILKKQKKISSVSEISHRFEGNLQQLQQEDHSHELQQHEPVPQ